MTSEWTETTLGERFPLIYGKGLRARDRNDTGDVDVFGSNGPFCKHDEPLTSGPTVVVGRKGSVGAVHFSNGPCWVGDTAFYVEEGPEYDIRFVYYLMRWLPLSDMNTDAAVPGLNRKNAHRLAIPDVPLNEQLSIAEVLGSLDDSIEASRRYASLVEQYMPFLVSRAETDDRLPVSGLGRFVNGGAYTKHANGEGRLVIRIAELNGGVGPSSKFSTIDTPAEKTAYPGDILFSWSGTLDVFRWTDDEAIVNQHIFKVLPADGVPAWVVYAKLREAMPEFQRLAADRATTMGHIKRGHLDTVTVAAWNLDDDNLIAAGDALWASHLEAHREVVALTRIRDTLLPELFSGRLRIDNPERLLADVMS